MHKTELTDLLRFLNASPSCYHAAANIASALEKAGFTRLWESRPWDVAPGEGY